MEDYEKFLDLCITNPDSLIFSDNNMEIHHIDGDTTNNSINNLQLLTKREHAAIHLNHKNNLYKVVKDKIVSIEFIKEDETYDIMCEAPYNNFIANDIIVHNSGKSVLLSQIRRDIIDHNPNEKILILSYEMEMLGVDQVTRDISSKIEMSTKQLYSADSEINPLSTQDLSKVNRIADAMKYYPIYIVDEIGTVEQIRDSILNFVETNQMLENNIGLVVTFDHSLLVDAPDGDSEKDVVDSLYRMLVKLKKHFETIGLRSMFIVLSQLNRNIESTERVINPNLQYPNKTDLFASSAAFYCSDVVIITHKPILVEGIRE